MTICNAGVIPTCVFYQDRWNPEITYSLRVFCTVSQKVVMASNVYQSNEDGNVKAIVVTFVSDCDKDLPPLIIEKIPEFRSEGIDLSL